MKLYVVVYSGGGYCREDDPIPQVAGVFNNEDLAKNVAKCNYGSKVVPIVLNDVPPGYIRHLEMLGIKL